MKKLIAFLLAGFCISANSATTLPVQLISAIAANTVLANATGLSASPTAFSMPSCATGVIHWTPGTGFTCSNTVSSLTSTGAITPSTTTGIVGTTLADSASAGSVGEYISANASSISLTSNVASNITSISLTPGDWDVTGQVVVIAAGGTVLTNAEAGINTTSATMPTVISGLGVSILTGTLGTGTNPAIPVMSTRVNVSVTTTVYLVASAVFTTSTCTANGFIRARRVR